MDMFQLRHGEDMVWINPAHIVVVRREGEQSAVVLVHGHAFIDERAADQLLVDLKAWRS